jgi:hypothetical protein
LLYADQGKLKKAEKLYVQMLQGREEAFGANLNSYVPALNNMWAFGPREVWSRVHKPCTAV